MSKNRKPSQGELERKFGIPYVDAETMAADDFKLIGGRVEAAEHVIQALKNLKWRADHDARKAVKVAREKVIIDAVLKNEDLIARLRADGVDV